MTDSQSQPGYDGERAASAGAGPSAAWTEVISASRTHAPQFEQAATNQRPKSRNYREPRLYRYEGTNLYQWYSKPNWGPLEEPFAEPFLITSASTAGPLGGQVRELDEQKQSPTEVEGLIERLTAYVSLEEHEGSDLRADILALADALARVTADLKIAGQYTEAHQRLDDMARESVATAEAELARTRIALEREKLARIIDPVAFEEHFLEDGRTDPEVAGIFEDAVDDARTKADAIIALVSPLGGGGGREEVRGLSVAQSGGSPPAAAKSDNHNPTDEAQP